MKIIEFNRFKGNPTSKVVNPNVTTVFCYVEGFENTDLCREFIEKWCQTIEWLEGNIVHYLFFEKPFEGEVINRSLSVARFDGFVHGKSAFQWAPSIPPSKSEISIDEDGNLNLN